MKKKTQMTFLMMYFMSHLLKTFLTAKKIHQHPRNPPMTFLRESDFTTRACCNATAPSCVHNQPARDVSRRDGEKLN